MKFYLLKNVLPMLLLLSYPLWGISQHVNFRNFTVKDGLPGNGVLRVTENLNGKLLLLTSKGLCEYNGVTFTSFARENGLTEDAFYFAEKDPVEDCLWLISNNFKLFKYQYNTFTEIKAPEHIAWMDIDPVTGKKWLMSRKGSIYALNGEQLLLHTRTLVLDTFIHNNEFYAYTFASLGKGAFIISTGLGFFHITPTSAHIVDGLHIYTPVSSFFPRIFRRPNGELLVTDEEGMHRYNPETNSITTLFLLNHSEIICYYEDTITHDVWIGTHEGAYFIKGGNIVIGNYKPYLQNKVVCTIYKDAEGTLWFTTHGDGIFTCNFLAIHYDKSDGLQNQKVDLLGKDSLRVYAISENGAISAIEGRRVTNDIRKNYSMLNNRIWAARQNPDKSTTLAIGSVYFDLKDKVIDSMPFLFATAMVKTPGHYMDKQDNLYYIDSNHRTSVILSHEERIKRDQWFPLIYVKTWHIYIDQKHTVYNAYDKYPLLTKINMRDTTIREAYYVGAKMTSSAGFYHDSLIIIATAGKGLMVLKNGKPFTWINKQQGLLSDICNKIIRDKEYLWVGTNKGISRLTLDRNASVIHLANFTDVNLLQENDVNDIAVFNDTVYVATHLGVSCFNRNVQLPKVPDNCYVERLQINYHDTVIQDEYSLPYSLNNLSITFAHHSLQTQKYISYRYTLEPGNDEPVPMSSNTLQLGSLQPGSYILSVWARNMNGQWSTQPAQLYITIHPPFWRAWWFIVLISLAVTITVGYIIYTYLRIQQNRAEFNTKLIESDLRSLRLHMNPHFIFNSLSSLQSFILTNRNDIANDYITSFSSMIRSIMNYSVTGEIPLREEIRLLEQYIELEMVRFYNQFSYTITVSDTIHSDKIVIPSLLIQPFVENAIKHGITGLKRKGILQVHFDIHEGELYCTVEDNGRGRPTSPQKDSTSFDMESTGIPFTRERIKLLTRNKSREVIVITDLMNDGERAGTRVTILVPILD